MFIYVGGVAGVGKTTIVKRTVELACKYDFPLQYMNEKKLLLKITGVGRAEEYAMLSRRTRVEARKQMVELFCALDQKDPTTIRIRDDHFTAPVKNGIYWIRQLKGRDRAHMLAFVTIVVRPDLIIQRRLTRQLFVPESNFFDFDAVMAHQDLEIGVARSQAKKLRISLRIFENRDGEAERTSVFLLNFVKKVAERSLG